MAALFALIGTLLLVPGGPQDVTVVQQYAFGSFDDASRILVTPEGGIFVVDPGRQSVIFYSTAKAEAHSVGGYGWLPGSFDRPTGVASDGVNVYVADYGNHRIQRFDRRLNFISALSTHDTSDAALRFGYPRGVALTGFGDLLILDGENHRLLKFTAGSRFDPLFAAAGINQGMLGDLVNVRVTPGGTIVLGERGALHVLDLFGNELRVIRDDRLKDLQGFDADDHRIVAVTDSALLWLSMNGTQPEAITPVHLMSEHAVRGMRDVALQGDLLYLLLRESVLVFRVTAH